MSQTRTTEILEYLETRATDYGVPAKTLINLNKISGVIPVTILGDLEALATTERTIWPAATLAAGAQAMYVMKTTAAACTIVSTDTEDTMTTGTGIWTVKVSGLDGNYLPISEVVEMNGTNAVTLTKQYLAVNQLNPELVGSAKTSQGDIIVKQGTDILAVIEDGTSVPVNITRQAVFTVPAGTTFYLNSAKAVSGKDDDADVHVYAVNPVNEVYVRQLDIPLYENSHNPLDGAWVTFPEKHLLEARALTGVASPKIVNINLSGYLTIDSIINEIEVYKL